MRFSIITITHNAERYLEKTLSSSLAQTFKDFEHLVWDNYSRDNTPKIAACFPHVTFHQGKDQGISDALNQASSLAKGKFLLHLHADDLFAHERVLECLDLFLRQYPSCQWLYGKAHIIDEKGDIVRTTPYEPYSARRLKKYNFITHPSTCFAKKLFQSVGGFSLDLRYAMDYDLWLRFSQKIEPFIFPNPIACFRHHPDSLSVSQPLKVADEAYRVRERYLKFFWSRFRSYLTWRKRCRRIRFQK